LFALAVFVLGAAAAGLFYAALPSVADAPARVRAIDARHASHPVLVADAAKIARAIVAVEDERFYRHGAIDPIAIARVIAATLSGDSVDPGGSTITQQLAKTLYVTDPETFTGRLRAIGLATKLEHTFSKGEILSMYLNAIYYGHGYFGINAASHGYFSRPVNALTWNQATLLAGLPQSPTTFDPYAHPKRARTRQHEVLAQLVRTGALRTRTARAITRAPLELHH